MTKTLLIAEGNPDDKNRFMAEHGVEAGADCHADVVRRYFPDIRVHVVKPADGPVELPAGVGLGDVDGMIIGGSGLHVYEDEPRVTRQIDLVRAALDAGVPVLGTCWGLQVGVVATGGTVARNPIGREVGVARKVCLTEAGVGHPMYVGKRSVFDSPCMHFDEATQLPSGGRVLASNEHSKVQAVDIPYGKSRFWGVQYHPEFDLGHIAGLYRVYGDDMLKGGFVVDNGALMEHIEELETVTADPSRRDLRWRLGVDDDVLNPDVRCLEIKNWVESL